MTQGTTGRRVVDSLNLSIDGRYAGPGGPNDIGFVVPYAVTDVARDHMTRMWETATTALIGRVNAEGFMGYWPPVADDVNADPRDRAFAKWLVDVDKVVLSSTLTGAAWERTRVVNRPAPEVVDDLRSSGSGDILVPSSASVIKALLAADKVDRLMTILVPETAGGGPRLFDDGIPAAKWSLTSQTTGELGEVSLVYDRIR